MLLFSSPFPQPILHYSVDDILVSSSFAICRPTVMSNQLMQSGLIYTLGQSNIPEIDSTLITTDDARNQQLPIPPESEFLNFKGASESIQRNQFH